MILEDSNILNRTKVQELTFAERSDVDGLSAHEIGLVL